MMEEINIEQLDEKHKIEITNIYKNMVNAKKWSDKMPIFKDIILDRKLSGNEIFFKYSEKYKDTRFAWGINRSFYDGTTRKMTNNDDEYNGYFWSMYINTLTMYDSHNKYGLNDICKSVDVYYYDVINTTFYVTDEQIEKLLEALNKWYLSSRDLAKESFMIEQKEKLKKQLAELEKAL